MASHTHDAPRTETELAGRHGPTGHTALDPSSARSATAGVISVITGAVGVVAGIIPLLGGFAVLLAVVALAAGIAAYRRGTRGRGFRYARFGILLGLIALVVGVLNLGIQLDWFDYFTTTDEALGALR